MSFQKTSADNQTSSPSNSNSRKNTTFILPQNGLGDPSSFISPRAQLKPSVGESNDKFEQEANAVADKVVSDAPTPTVQKAPALEKDEDVQMKCEECEEEGVQMKLQMKAGVPADDDTGINSQIDSAKGKGSPMDNETASFMSDRFDADFSDVRIHTGEPSIQMNRDLGARAFAHGSDIHFNQGEYNPSSKEGKRLLAHELTHTIQQGKSKPNVQRKSKGDEGSVAQNISSTKDSAIQRSTSWAAGRAVKDVNLARHILGGRFPQAMMTVNGMRLDSYDAAEVSMRPVMLDSSSEGNAWKVKIQSVPHNEGGVHTRTLTPGPWTRRIPKSRLSQLEFNCVGDGYTNFRAKGSPDDRTVARETQAHEARHAEDHRLAFRNTIEAWDKKLTKAQIAGTWYHGATPNEARNNLWADMGGTPAQVARAFKNECEARGKAFHSTPKGTEFEVIRTGSDSTCDNSWALVR